MQKYKIVWIIFILMHSLLYAKVDHVNYKGTFGIFGTVGIIKNRVEKKSNTYRIETTVTLAGMAKMLLGGQTEHYISKGHMENGFMVTDYYEMVSRKKGKVVTKSYTVNHKQKYVTKKYKKVKNGKIVKERTEKLPFYAKDDLLTLYFNMDRHIKTHKGKHSFMLKAVGLEKQKGLVKITVASPSDISSYKKDLGKSADWYAKALIVQKNFRKKKGDILLSVDKDGYIKKAVIKDILLYGDAKLDRIK